MLDFPTPNTWKMFCFTVKVQIPVLLMEIFNLVAVRILFLQALPNAQYFIAGHLVEPVSLSLTVRQAFLLYSRPTSLNFFCVFLKGSAAVILILCALAQLADAACWREETLPKGSLLIKFHSSLCCHDVH